MTDAAPDTFRFGAVEIRPAQRLVLVEGRPAPLGARAIDVLMALLAHRDRVVGKQELLEMAWPGLVVEENNLQVQISSLRKLLGAQAIATVPGRGYRFTAALTDSTPAAPARVQPASRGHLPFARTALIGREADLAALIEQFAQTPFLTIVGAGGVGKTRMALEVAARVRADHADGVCLVELAPVSDPALLHRAVASALGVGEEAGRPLPDTVLDCLRERQMLLVLDNCEHLIEPSARFAHQVLAHCAGTRLLATSREPLGVAGEVAWRLPSLRTPDPEAGLSPQDLLGYAAVRLFVERARAASGEFRLTAENRRAVALICQQLDGIPLALELAAARVGSMRVEQIAERLNDRFALLARGPRAAQPRQQTLRSLVDWSHDLLSEPERVLLRRLAPFAGGWTLEAAEAVCGAAPLAPADVLDLLSQLVDKSLVVLDRHAAEPRYRMLETFRQYGLERLRAAGELDATRDRHLHFFVDLADRIRPMLTREDQLVWHARAETEIQNFRLALHRALASGEPELGLRLFSSLQRFSYKNLYWKEMVEWQARLAAALPPQARAQSLHHARSLYGAAMLATNYDPALGRSLAEECLAASSALAFDEGIAWALAWMGYIDTRQRDPATAALFQQSLVHGRRLQDEWRRAFLLGQAMILQAGYEAVMGLDQAAEHSVAECDAEFAKIGGDKLYRGHGRALLGTIAIRRGDFERAEQLLAEGLALHQAVESTFDIAGSLAQQGFLALRRGQPQRALALFRQSLPLHRDHPFSPGVTRGLAQLLIAFAACERWAETARLAGALGAAAAEDGEAPAAPAEISGRMQRSYEEAVAAARSALPAQAYLQAVEAGRRMTRAEAIDYALEAPGRAEDGFA